MNIARPATLRFARHAASAAVAMALLTAAGVASAESNFQTGAGALTATAKLDFQINIPRYLYLRVGTGTAMATNAVVDKITFDVAATNVGAGAVAGTGGDLGTGTVSAVLLGNSGAITLTSTTLGALSNGASDTISFAKITTTASALGAGTPLPAPALADGATTSTTVAAVGKIVNRDAKWTYGYANDTVVPAGTYGGTNTNNSRVTYTASLP
jgi:hypothetical protein